MSDTPPPLDAARAAFYERVSSYVGLEVGDLIASSDEVNVPMVRAWCETMGDTNPIYLDAEAAAASAHGGLVAPPAMLQAWVMRPFGSARPAPTNNPYAELLTLFDENFPSVVATNCDQEYFRYVRPGDRLSMRTVIDSVSEEKTTALGTGHFVTSRQDYFDQHGERVGSMLFRILRFRPHPKPATATAPPAPAERPLRPRPSTTHDQQWWFDALHNDGKLLIQRCAECGELRQPTGPMCATCQSLKWEPVESTGTGTIYSFVVTHFPQVPSFEYPLPILLVEMDPVPGRKDQPQSVRVLGNTVDTDLAAVVIGARVELVVTKVDDALSLPFFRVVSA